jgi:NitT/TauT family transport system substrate-binding protein
MRAKMMRRTLRVIGLILTITSLGIDSSCSQCSYSGRKDTISFGSNTSGACAFIYIAQDQHFFEANGLSVNVRDYPTGAAAIDAVLKSETDFAWSSEFPLVRRAFSKEKISAFTVVNRFSDQYIFGRKDSGVKNITDLKRKKIGVPRNTIAEFYLTRFLTLNGISIGDVSLVDVLPAQAIDTISSGSVDAAVVWEPYSSRMKAQLSDRVVMWSVQSSQPGFGVISGSSDWLAGNPRIVIRFLKSLVKAQDYLIRNTKAARGIIQKRLNYDDASMDILWSESLFLISLDQALIAAMEDEARWMIANKLTNEKRVPDFLNYIYWDGLKTVKPEALNIIR